MVYTVCLLLALKLALVAGACPQDFVEVESSCYFFSRNKLEWPSAKKICEEFYHGNLAELTSAREDVAIQQMIKHNNLIYWLGADDIQVEGDWRLASTGQPLTYSDWGVGEPNNYNHISEDCLAVSPILGWVDAPCTEKLYYICELPTS